MDKKGQDEDSVSFSNDPSPGLSSSTSDNKTSRENQRESEISAISSEISAISSERVQSDLQTSVKSDLGSQAGKDTKDSNTGRAEVSLEEPTKKAPSPYNQLKALSSSSKESGDLVQLNSVDFVNPKPCLSSNENTASGCSHISDGSLYVIREEDHMKGGKNGCNFDLNEEGMEPLHVVAKFGVLIGRPEKPLQFGGELGWRSSITTSAFRPTFSKNSPRENGVSCGSSRQSLASQGIDLNVAFTMDSEPHENHSSKHCEKQGVSRFDLNDSPVIEDSCKNTRQMGETRDTSRNYVLDSRSPSYWVDMRSIQGFNHIQSGPFLVTAPSYEQLQMVVPIQSEISFMPSTFYPPGILPYLNNNHRPMTPMIPHFPGSVVTPYPQVLYPATHISPDFRENGGMAIMAPLSAKRREPEGGWDYSRGNYRQMGSRK